MAEPRFYRSKSGAMEVELAPGPNGVCLTLYPVEPRAKDWNGAYLDVATARRLADDLATCLKTPNAAD